MAPTRRGFTLIELMIVIAIIAIIAAIAIPNLISARKVSNETAAIGALKTLATAESIFREGDKEGDGRIDYGNMAELGLAQLIDGVLASGTKQGYRFVGPVASLTTPEFLWFCPAWPVVPRTTGDRYFGTNHSGVIWYTTGEITAFDMQTCAPFGQWQQVGK